MLKRNKMTEPNISQDLYEIFKEHEHPNGQSVANTSQNEILRLDTVDENSLSNRSITKSQMRLLEVEKEEIEKQLHEAQISISQLQEENKSMDKKISIYKAALTDMECSISSLQKQEEDTSVAHAHEIADIMNTMRTQFQEERDQLINHMRELNKQKQEVDAEVINLNLSLVEVKKSLKLKHEGSTNASQKEVENLKVELKMIKKFLDEMERSHGVLIEAKNALESKACQLEIENTALRENGHSECITEETLLKSRLETAEKRISDLEHDKIASVVSAEQIASTKIVNMQLKHKKDIDAISGKLEEALATITAQEQRIQMLQPQTSTSVMWNPEGIAKVKISPRKKDNPLLQRNPERDDISSQNTANFNCHHLSSPPQCTSGTIGTSLPSYFGGRWTAHRADYKKHAQEMLIITEALEAEGYGPNQATVDEVIRHLWWKKEHIFGELQTAKQTLNKALGKEQYQVIQECQEERLLVEKKLEETTKKLLHTREETEAIQTCFQKELANLLTEKHSAVQKNDTILQHLELMEKENKDIRLSLQRQHKTLMEKKAQIVDVETKLGTSMCEVSYTQGELARERQKNAHYQARVDSLNSRLATQNAELKKSIESHSLDKKKLDTTEEHAQKAHQQIMFMKMKVSELEGDLPLQKMQFTQVAKERDSLLKQVDTLTAQLADLEGRFGREKTNSSTLQVKVDELEEELHLKTDQLLHAFCRQNELELEVSSVRSDQQAALENAAKLESDLLLSHVALKSAKAELLHFQEMSKKLQNSVVAAQKELEVSHRELEVERNTITKLELSLEQLGNVKSQLETVSFEMTKTRKQLTDRDGAINKLKEETKSLRVSKEEIGMELQTRIAELETEKRKLREAHSELEIKSKELNAAQVQMEKLQCTLTCESEKNSSIKIDLSMKESDLKDCQQRCTALSNELMQFKQQHKEAVEAQSSLISKLKSEIMSAEIQNRNSVQELKSLKEHLKEEKEISSSLQDKLQSSEGAFITMKEELQCTVKELSSKTFEKESLESTVTVFEEKNQELSEQLVEIQKEYEECRAQFDSAKTELSLTQSQLRSTTEQLEVLKGALELEREEKSQFQANLKSSESIAASLHQKIIHLEQELIAKRENIKSLTADLTHTNKNYEELSKLVCETQQELFTQQEMGKEAQDSYSHTISTLKDKHMNEMMSLKQENKSLDEELKKTRNHILVVQEHQRLCETESSECSTKLSLMKQKCSQLEKEIESKTNMYKSLESHAARLESDNTESRLKLSDLNDKVAAQSEIIDQLKVDLDHSCRERDSLHEQIQLQRETAAASINRMQSHNQEKCAELHKRIEEQAGKLKEVQAASKSSRQETANLKAENHTLSLTICEKEESLSLLRDQFREESTQLKLSQQRIAQLESALLEEQKCKKGLQEAMSEEHTKRVEYEAIGSEKEKQLQYVSQELQQCKNFLTREKTCTEKFRGDINMLQTKLATTEAQLEATRESLRECKLKTEREVTSLRQKYHTERRTLKDRLRELHTHLHTVKAQYDSRGEEISRLGATNQLLTENQQELSRKATETEQQLQCKADECKSLELKVQSLEIQIVQSQKELASAKRVLVEVEEQKKKVEARSRSDVKRVLVEVTEHMEQQYSNQRYLDRLRADNETVALLERERQIGQLKNELKQKKQEVKKDRLQIERLTAESKHLQHQHKEHECSRRRLEARLEQVNDTLSHTLPSLSRTLSGSLSHHPSNPLLCSTPLSRSYKKY